MKQNKAGNCCSPKLYGKGHYWRCLGDLPCFGRPVILRVHVRRFRCVNDTCPRRTFGEPLPRIARCRARHTERLRSSHHAIALALGGNPGARLATRTGMPVGATTLLRRIREADLDPPLPPRVLGVDDWAWRKASTTARSCVISSAGAGSSTCCPGRDPGRVAEVLYSAATGRCVGGAKRPEVSWVRMKSRTLGRICSRQRRPLKMP